MFPAEKRKPRRRWVLAVGAALGAIVTTFTESVVLGETIGHLLAQALDALA